MTTIEYFNNLCGCLKVKEDCSCVKKRRKKSDCASCHGTLTIYRDLTGEERMEFLKHAVMLLASKDSWVLRSGVCVVRG